MTHNHWRATRARWAFEHRTDGHLLTGDFPLSCGTIVRLPRLFATKNKALDWGIVNLDGIGGWKVVRVELGYRRITKENPF